MHNNSAIFAISTVLLVPFLYYTASIPDACAADSRYYTSADCTSHKDGSRTCCWREPIPGSILGQTVCQTCKQVADKDSIRETCTWPTKQALKVPESGAAGPLQEGGVLEDPATSPKLGQDVFPKDGGVFEQPERNMTF